MSLARRMHRNRPRRRCPMWRTQTNPETGVREIWRLRDWTGLPDAPYREGTIRRGSAVTLGQEAKA